MILTIIVFLLVIGILVVAHEFGHFIAAKKAGVKVEEFAIGFPPRIYSVKKGETEYSINAIPLGGYVKMLGELEHSKDKRAFENQKPGKRFIIAIAGVVMNFVLAWFLLTIGFAIGMTPVVSDPASIPGKVLSDQIIIADVNQNSAADKAGLVSGDILLEAKSGTSDFKFKSASDVTNFTDGHQGDKVELIIKRNSDTKTLDATLAKGDAPLGVAIIDHAVIRVPWYKAPYIGLHETYEITKLTVDFLGSFFSTLFVHGKVSQGVGGPIAIYVYTGLAIKAGIMILLQFVALLSINLGLINILPFPALDGGRLIFIILEAIFRRKMVEENVENIIHTVGYALLILLVLLVTYKDVLNLIHK